MRDPQMPLSWGLLLSEARRERGLSQKDLARMSGVGEKSISSFETSKRIDSLKVAQLERLLRAMDLTLEQFVAKEIYLVGSPRIIHVSHRTVVQDRVEQLRRWLDGAREEGISPQEISDIFGRLHYDNARTRNFGRRFK